MTEHAPLLFELGTEELPAHGLRELSHRLGELLIAGLRQAELDPGDAHSYATPRRLAVVVDRVTLRQPERRIERLGPALRGASTTEGKASAAAEGFARACGVPVAELERVETPQGARLAYRTTRPGGAAKALLPGIVTRALETLPLPRRMRWGAGEFEFIRPVHWAVLLLGREVVPAHILGVESARHSYGHRFHYPRPLAIDSPAVYATTLAERGYVLADFDRRRQRIERLVMETAHSLGGEARVNPELLEEVTALVEWPVALAGHFETRFLQVPHEALVSTMQENQRYFPVQTPDGRLLPAFVAIANIASRQPDEVRRGNERVVRPRFADAEFFWTQDRRVPLAARLDTLATVTFEKALGSVRDKADRLSVLASELAANVAANSLHAKRAAQLCKCDLVTQMVFEFPELQGVMGGYYALADGEAPEVAQAIRDHYLPRHAGDLLPGSQAGIAVALADRLDTLIGIFAAGKPPSGTKDPFALRRAALGVVRIVLEKGIELDLVAVLDKAAGNFAPSLRAVEQVQPVFDFIVERMRGPLLEQGVATEEFDAVAARRPSSLLDFQRRIEAVREFRSQEAASSLAAANKRIRNILRRAEEPTLGAPEPAALVDPHELALAQALEAKAQEVAPLLAARDYRATLLSLADLRATVDAFFDGVMVMTDDPKLRRNRLALLASLEALFLTVADFSRLQDQHST